MPKHLIDGFHHFIKDHRDLMADLVSQGQNPEYFIISCIDSRAHAGTVFHVPPGTYFAHKAMGAIVRPYQTGTALAAALQFALIHNNVKTLVIMGHTGCGAVKAMIDDIEDPEISSFIKVARDALDLTNKEQHDPHTHQSKTEENVVKLSYQNLKQYPSVKWRLNKGDLEIKGWLFNMHEGAIYEYDENVDEFKKITGQED